MLMTATLPARAGGSRSTTVLIVFQRSAQPTPGARPPRSRRARFTAALLALLAVAGYAAFRVLTGTAPARCTVQAGGDRLEMVPQQAANAATIGAVASSRDLPERALAVALATAMQESRLRNLGNGDRDSIGLFQQRPSQGWGTERQIMDPVFSVNEFFDQLVNIPGYSRLPLTVAAQRVQHSGYPRAYARHEADASLLASALSGRVPSLTCRVRPPEQAGDAPAVRQQVAREFGAQVLQDSRLGSPAPGGASGHGHRHGGGPTVVVPSTAAVSSPDQDPGRHGWVLAQWAVAQAVQLRITEVSFAGRAWRAARSADGWVPDRSTPVRPNGDVRITVAR